MRIYMIWQKLKDCSVCECLLAFTWNRFEVWEIRNSQCGQEVNESQAGYSIRCSGNGTFELYTFDRIILTRNIFPAVNFQDKQLVHGKGRPTRDCWDYFLEQTHVLPGNMLPLAMSSQLLLMIQRNRRALKWECGMMGWCNDATMEWWNDLNMIMKRDIPIQGR